MKETNKAASNAKELNFPDIERLELMISTETDKQVRAYVSDICLYVELEKVRIDNMAAYLLAKAIDSQTVEQTHKREFSKIYGEISKNYGKLLYEVQEKMYLICKRNGLNDSDIAASIGVSKAWFSECRYPLGHSRARSPQTTYDRLYKVIQARKSALFALFASRKWHGVDADEFVQGVRNGELEM